MADITDFLPIFGNRPLFGPSANDVAASILPGQTPPIVDPNNPFMPPPDHMTVGGVPLQSLAGGGLGGLIAASMARKRHRALAFGQGFMLGNQLFQKPIEDERRRQDAIMTAAINKGWLIPSSAVGAAPNITGTAAPTTTPTATATPTVTPSAGVSSSPVDTSAPATGATPGVDQDMLRRLAANMTPESLDTMNDATPVGAETPETTSTQPASVASLVPLPTVPPRTTPTATTPVPKAAPTAAAAAPTTPAATTTYGGMRFAAAPFVRVGDLYPGENLPASVANAMVPATAETGATALAGIEHQRTRQYVASLGLDPNMPEKLALQVAQGRMSMQELARLREQYPITAGMRRQYAVGPQGISVSESMTDPEKIKLELETLRAQRDSATNAAEAHKLDIKFREKQLEYEPIRQKSDALSKSILGGQDQLRSLSDQLHLIKPDPITQKFTPDQVAERNELTTAMTTLRSRISDDQDELTRLGGGTVAPKPPPVSPQEDQFNKRFTQLVENIKGSQNPLTYAYPRDAADYDTFQKAREFTLHETAPLVRAIKEHMRGRGGFFFGNQPDAKWEADMRKNYPDLYDSALRIWKATQQNPGLEDLYSQSLNMTPAFSLR